MTSSPKPATFAPTSAKGVSTPPSSAPSKTDAARQQFMMASLTMGWQLAIVVLVPILLGFRADKHFGTLPLWTSVGFLLAMSGMTVVVWRQMQLFSPKITQADIANAKKLRDAEENDDQ